MLSKRLDFNLFLIVHKFRCPRFQGNFMKNEKLLRLQLMHLFVVCLFAGLVILYMLLMTYLNHSSVLIQVGCSISTIDNRTTQQHLWSNHCKSQNQTLSKRLPDCIIVGIRKCGTRALLEFLDIHPQIQKVTEELHFFDDKYDRGLEWYRQQMPQSTPDQVVIEKTPAYFVTESVPERIYAMNASIKIILIVRDPVTRLISDYAQLASNKAKKDRRIQSFENVVMHPTGKINSNYKGVRISMYAVHFFRWIKLFSKNQIHVVDGDQFVYDPLPELEKIENFLGLSHYINHDNFIYNTTKGFYCIRLDGNGEKCLNKNKGRKHPEINALVIRKLRKFYSPYNKYFYKLVGQKFAWPE